MHGCQVVEGRYGMQAGKPVKTTIMKCNRKRISRGKWYTLLNARAGRDNWIGEAIVNQAIHEAMCYIHHIGIPLVSLRITC